MTSQDRRGPTDLAQTIHVTVPYGSPGSPG